MNLQHHHAESYFADALEVGQRAQLVANVDDEYRARHQSAVSAAYVVAVHHNPLGILHRVPTTTDERDSAPVAYAELAHGRWIVRCPMDGCTSAQHASATDHRFFCAYCRNEQVGYQYVKLVWPDEKTVEKIERVMLQRAGRLTRNWAPGETLKKIRSENKKHGLPTG